MDVELLVLPDCPNEAPAAALLRSALALAGLTTKRFVVTVIADEQAASRRGFAGSPTFLINGSDPFVGSEQPSGLPAGSTGGRTAARRACLTLGTSGMP